MRRLVPPLIRGWPAVVLAVAAVGAAPAPAAAACGDYLVIRGADDQPAVPHGEPAGATTPADPLPCHGPNCSGSPVRDPLAPAVPPPAGGGAKDCVTFGDGADPSAAGRSLPIPDSVARPRGAMSSIFHPPRAG